MEIMPTWRGRWTRQRLIVPGTPDDVSTTVIWLQSGALFVDIRIPPYRPSFAECRDLADCTPAQREWLARQEGFAGHLETFGDLLRWHRHFEFGQPAVLPDAGRMRQETDWWIEEGLHAPYVEHWAHEPWRGGTCLGRKFMFGPSTSAEGWREGVAVVVDDCFMLALDRPRRAGAVVELPALDVEISFGAIDHDAATAQITLSTLPFREGLVLAGAARPEDPPALGFLRGHPSLHDQSLRWQEGTTA